jgi:hypothetical protein
VCGAALERDRTVWCRDCQTPHHRDCFAYAGKCAIYGCGCMRFNESAGRAPGVRWIEIKDPGGDYVPQGYVVDFSSQRETLANVLLIVCGVAMIVCAMPPDRHREGPVLSVFWATVAAIGFFIGAYLRANTDDYRVIDAKTRKIWLHRKFGRTVTNTPEAEFYQCKELVVAWHEFNFKGHKRQWTLYLHLIDGSAIQLTDSRSTSAHMPCPDWMRETATKVSQLIGCPEEWRGEWEPQRLR